MGFHKIGGEPDPDTNVIMMFQLDQMIKKSIQILWVTLPPEQRSIDEVEELFAQLVTRTFQDFRNSKEAIEQWQAGYSPKQSKPNERPDSDVRE